MLGGRFLQQLRVGLRQGMRARGAGAAPAGAPRGVAAAAGAAGALGQLVQRAGLKLAGGAMVLGGGGTAFTLMSREEQIEIEAGSVTAQLPWVQELAAQPGMREVLIPGQQLRKHPVGQLVSEEDHLFETMRRSDQIKEFRCFYDPAQRAFHSVVVLGKDVCGYPSTVHGGLTAAIVDETLGGLYTALLTSGSLGLRLPGLTARLEMDYKRRIAAPAVLRVSAEVESVEPRKVWMRASVRDGDGNVYATARGLFVAPNVMKQLGLQLRQGAPAKQQQAGAAAAALA